MDISIVWPRSDIWYPHMDISMDISMDIHIHRNPANLAPFSRYKKVKLSHTRYRALGQELIPVYRQSARRWLFKAVGCHYFSPGLRSPFQSKNVTVLLSIPSYTGLVTETHRCEQLAQSCYAVLSRWELNPRPIDRKSNALLLRHCAATLKTTCTLS